MTTDNKADGFFLRIWKDLFWFYYLPKSLREHLEQVKLEEKEGES